jgi:hypothetical protein
VRALARPPNPPVGDGPLRELLNILASALFSPTAFYFAPTPDGGAFHVHPFAPDADTLPEAPRIFEAAGRLVGLSVTRGIPLGMNLSLPLLKRMMGQKIGWADIKYFDNKVHASLQKMLSEKHPPEYWEAAFNKEKNNEIV